MRSPCAPPDPPAATRIRIHAAPSIHSAWPADVSATHTREEQRAGRATNSQRGGFVCAQSDHSHRSAAAVAVAAAVHSAVAALAVGDPRAAVVVWALWVPSLLWAPRVLPLHRPRHRGTTWTRDSMRCCLLRLQRPLQHRRSLQLQRGKRAAIVIAIEIEIETAITTLTAAQMMIVRTKRRRKAHRRTRTRRKRRRAATEIGARIEAIENGSENESVIGIERQQQPLQTQSASPRQAAPPCRSVQLQRRWTPSTTTLSSASSSLSAPQACLRRISSRSEAPRAIVAPAPARASRR